VERNHTLKESPGRLPQLIGIGITATRDIFERRLIIFDKELGKVLASVLLKKISASSLSDKRADGLLPLHKYEQKTKKRE
jgi:hypothetical protein